MKRNLLLLGLAVFLAAPMTAAADENPPLFENGTYFEFAAGVAHLSDRDANVAGQTVALESSNGPTYLVTGGYDFGHSWPLGGIRVELALSYRNNDVDAASLGDTPVPGAAGSTETWSLTYNVINDFRPGTAFDPYIGVGIGYGWTAMDYGQRVGGAYTQLVDDDDGGFAWAGLVGVRSRLTEHLSLDVRLRVFGIPGAQVRAKGGEPVDAMLGSQSIMLGLTYTL
ncbi:MAG TPA: outer membrane beta-barrel protein [Gammaproteobacteria bacterium]|nr:outer membrane beta-barrel protein [Gammaproteobacteria bacterium]